MDDENSGHLCLPVAHYHPVWLPGTMTWLHRLVTDLQRYCDNIVICEQIINRERFGHVTLRDFSSLPRILRYYQRFLKKTGLVQSLPFYIRALKKDRIKLLHSHFGHIAVQGCKMADDARIPHVASFYGLDLHQVPASDSRWKSRYLEMFAQTRRIFCEGEHMAKSIEGLGCPVEKITIHPLGIDLDRVTFHPVTWDGQEPLRILIAASFREKKGIPLALKAVAAIRKILPVFVTIIGDATPESVSQHEKKRIHETIKQLKMKDIIDFRGYLSHDEMLNEARFHHIFLSPSIHAQDGDSEGGAPVGIIEMSAAGMMVVSSRHCDIPGVIRHEETGWLAEEGNLEDLITNLRKAVDHRNIWHKMAKAARDHISAHFDARTQALKLHRHYLEVIGE